MDNLVRLAVAAQHLIADEGWTDEEVEALTDVIGTKSRTVIEWEYDVHVYLEQVSR